MVPKHGASVVTLYVTWRRWRDLAIGKYLVLLRN